MTLTHGSPRRVHEKVMLNGSLRYILIVLLKSILECAPDASYNMHVGSIKYDLYFLSLIFAAPEVFGVFTKTY